MESTRPTTRRLLINWGILALSLVALAAAVWLFRRSLLEGPGDGNKGGRSFEFTVKVAPVKMGPLSPTLRLQGDVVARHATTVRAEVAGVVTAMPAREGQAVKREAVLARLDDRDPRLILRQRQAQGLQAAASVERQQAELAKARDLLRRLERLRKDQLVSQEELDNARIGVQSAEAALAAARAQAAQHHVEQLAARRDLARTVVRAPFDGQISQRFVEVGDRVAVGTPVAELVGGAGVELRLYLPVSQVSRVLPGTPLRYRLAEQGGAWHEARISRVLPGADPRSRNQTAVVALKQPPASFAPGLAVEAELAVGRIPRALLVSRDALTRYGNRWVVFRVEGGKARRIPVVILAEAGRQAAVTGPLKPGHKVVVVGNETLFPNAPVNVVNRKKMARGGPRPRGRPRP